MRRTHTCAHTDAWSSNTWRHVFFPLPLTLFFFFALFHCNGGCRCRDVLGGGGGAQTWHESPRASGSLSLQVPQVGRTVRNIDRAQQFLQLATTVVRKDKRPLLLLAVWRWQQRQNTRVRGTGRARATQ